jgi:hypothetical protein
VISRLAGAAGELLAGEGVSCLGVVWALADFGLWSRHLLVLLNSSWEGRRVHDCNEMEKVEDRED